MNLKELLIRHEGLKLRPYKDKLGYLTIGVGRCLDTNGISREEALILLDNDIANIYKRILQFYGGWFYQLSSVRQDVIISMIFNLGFSGFSRFVGMIDSLKQKDFNAAADEMLQSIWASQVGRRAQELAIMMRTDKYPDDQP